MSFTRDIIFCILVPTTAGWTTGGAPTNNITSEMVNCAAAARLVSWLVLFLAFLFTEDTPTEANTDTGKMNVNDAVEVDEDEEEEDIFTFVDEIKKKKKH